MITTSGINFDEYRYPIEHKMKPIKRSLDTYGPFGTQWIHDVQFDDPIDSKISEMRKRFDVLRAVKVPEQRTLEWYKMRDEKITASDGGCVVGVNDHEPEYKFIVKKTIGSPFIQNEFCYHGKKYEEIATLIYEYRMNVSSDEFGLMGHPIYSFLGASPDRICNYYKNDGKHLSKYVGRMIEIKCPLVRKIKMDGEIINHICPIYYWVQVQLQLECCNLEECDFWQCEIKEYESQEEFLEDTDPSEPFRSKRTGFEKGCLIQLIAKKRMPDIIAGKYLDVIYEDSIWIYPPKIEMSPYDCSVWIAETLPRISNESKYADYYFDKVLYWKLIKSKSVTILRDRDWFTENLPILQKMWNYVLTLRENKDNASLLDKYINSRVIKKSKEIMSVIDKLCNLKHPQYNKFIESIKQEIETGMVKVEQKKEYKKNKYSKENEEDVQYMFV
jgi:putative phage-type endonuclease